MNKADSLMPIQLAVIRDQGTEAPYIGKYTTCDHEGTYLCRQCGLALFRSSDKFMSSCGWPSFDDEISGTLERLPDQESRRTEIRCKRCHAHLGHVFIGEGFTQKNQRHCVNSIALDFVESCEVLDTGEVIYAGGCFWGMQQLLEAESGVLFSEVGYIGGSIDSPSYEQVCSKTSGHYEAVRVVYDIQKLSFEKLTRLFFEIHDPTQANGQGPDIGPQYKSAIFYYNIAQKEAAVKLIEQLKGKGFDIATQLIAVQTFWPAEEYHQHYYLKTGKAPYCHRRISRF